MREPDVFDYEAAMEQQYPGDSYPEGHVQPRCNRCHDYNVRWRQQGGRWVLFSSRAGVPHVCAIDTSDFGPVAE